MSSLLVIEGRSPSASILSSSFATAKASGALGLGHVVALGGYGPAPCEGHSKGFVGEAMARLLVRDIAFMAKKAINDLRVGGWCLGVIRHFFFIGKAFFMSL